MKPQYSIIQLKVFINCCQGWANIYLLKCAKNKNTFFCNYLLPYYYSLHCCRSPIFQDPPPVSLQLPEEWSRICVNKCMNYPNCTLYNGVNGNHLLRLQLITTQLLPLSLGRLKNEVYKHFPVFILGFYFHCMCFFRRKCQRSP